MNTQGLIIGASQGGVPFVVCLFLYVDSFLPLPFRFRLNNIYRTAIIQHSVHVWILQELNE